MCSLPLHEVGEIQREGRERREAAEDARGEKRAQVERALELQRQRLRSDDAHQQAAHDIDEEGPPGKAAAEPTPEADVDEMPRARSQRPPAMA